jgi:hypothetical protein
MPPIRFRIRTLMIVIAAVAVLMALGPILVDLDATFALRSLFVLLVAIVVSWLLASLALWIALAAFGIAYLFRRTRTTLGILRASLSPEPDRSREPERV